MSSPEILVSGCGISYCDFDQCHTWTKLLRASGASITSLAAPAVSNQYILTGLINEVLSKKYDVVICQLTGLGKLDVYIETPILYKELVSADPSRNFVVSNKGKLQTSAPGIWPSSHSVEHNAKKLWASKLYNESYDCFNTGVMVNALSALCTMNGAQLVVVQGYPIDWDMATKIAPSFKLTVDPETRIINSWYEMWCLENGKIRDEVPGQQFQFILAEFFLEKMKNPEVSERLVKIRDRFSKQTK